jgi:hypothetical protein
MAIGAQIANHVEGVGMAGALQRADRDQQITPTRRSVGPSPFGAEQDAT